MKNLRGQELRVLGYRLGLVFLFYQIARLLFWYYNRDLIQVVSLGDYLRLAYYGTAFDTTAILYTNSLFILLSVLPLVINTSKIYQKALAWIYFVINGLAYAMNFGDFIYYKFSMSRLTVAVLDVAGHESNLAKVFLYSIIQNPSVILCYIGLMGLWIFLYQKVKIQDIRPAVYWRYFLFSIFTLCVITALAIGGIRGDFKHSTRPINMVDASKHTKNPTHANIVLNSVFSFLRTIGSNNFEEVNFVEPSFIEQYIKPYKYYQTQPPTPQPNVVILIIESFGREYSGAFNAGKDIPDYQSYTPFIDSLAKESLIFPNTFANGRQSIHGMSSILAGIPALRDAFTGSPYANQPIQSIVSVCNDMGYDTSFYHGAPNGSMGFQGFANILGFKHYFGKDEYNNDDDWDGIWAIWDEPFLQYFAKNLGDKQPFMATMFTASSHHPFKIPEQYQGKFKKGYTEMHQPIQYTDYALRRFFQAASRQPWFSNTIFVITGDHTNKVYYDEYRKAMNAFAVPLLLYSPNPHYQLKGVSSKIAQQIDIYPTLAHLIGYNRSIRSWGRSLIQKSEEESHMVVNSNGIQEQMIIGDYIYTFNGKDVEGIYDIHDLNLDNNLIDKIETEDIQQGKLLCKAWYQDYMYRVIRRKLK